MSPQLGQRTTLNEHFSEVSYKQLIEGLVEHEFYDETKQISHDSGVIKSVENIGTFQGNRFHNILIIKHSAGIDARVKLATETFKLIAANNIDAALVAYHSEENDQWRISLVTLAFEENKQGRIVKKFSNPRRFSYVLGSSAKTVTPYKYLISKGVTSNFDDLVSRFSVEVVNNEFYKEIAKLYDELVGTDDKSAAIEYPDQGEACYQFAVRLIGRIVFCWFLREKHSTNNVPLISKTILSRDSANQNNYYHSTIAPLFFEILNKPISSRSERFQIDAFGKVPYLNGGLFAPQVDDHYRYDKVLAQSTMGLVNIPDDWLRKLLDLLELYHFTVDENTSIDIDLSIDPEMLGRIFENLLARINPETGETVRKSTGSFYTPREIVEYMVDESLIEYLKPTLISEDKLRALVSYSLDDDIENPLGEDEKRLIIKALQKVKILDPACGSGAFPIGILQKIVFMLQQVDPDAKLWFENQIAHTNPEVRHLIEREFEHKNFNYIRKLGIIRESIFGVDIQTIATEIARLRCFLTLIVDERVNDDEDNRGVYPLPNLDFKFVTANTLTKLDMGGDSGTNQTDIFEDQSGIDELKQLRDDYFNSHNSERETLKLQFLQSQNRMLQKMITHHTHGYSDVTQKLSTWDPFSNKSTSWFDSEWMFGVREGFDIVLGNPPYVDSESMVKNDKEFRDQLSKIYETTKGNWDLYIPFIELGFSQLSNRGLLTYITPNKWLSADYGLGLRAYIADNITLLTNLDSINVFDAGNNPTVFTLCKNSDSNKISINFMNSDYMVKDVTVVDKDKIDVSNFATLMSKNGNLIQQIQASSVSIGDYFIVENPFTVSEAYAVKPLIHEQIDKKDNFKFCNTGTITPYGNKWGVRKTTYLKSKFDNPVVNRELFEEQFPKRFNQNVKSKIIFKGMRHFDSFYDEAGDFIAGKTTLIATPIDGNVDVYGYLGVLNSSLIKWYIKELYSSRGIDGGISFNTKIVKSLPIPSNTNLISKISTLAKKLSHHQSAGVNEDIGKVNELVYRLYDLNTDDISIIEGSML